MAEEKQGADGAAGPENKGPTAEDRPQANGRDDAAPPAAEEQAASKTQQMLHDAVHKVMEEIEYHEGQARRHLQQAAELKKGLKDSIALLQRAGAGKVDAGGESGGKEAAAGVTVEGKAGQPQGAKKRGWRKAKGK